MFSTLFVPCIKSSIKIRMNVVFYVKIFMLKTTMLDLIHIKKDYYVDKKPFAALKDLSISFKGVGFVAILGPSGCGKATTLNIIGGLDHYTSGDLLSMANPRRILKILTGTPIEMSRLDSFSNLIILFLIRMSFLMLKLLCF